MAHSGYKDIIKMTLRLLHLVCIQAHKLLSHTHKQLHIQW